MNEEMMNKIFGYVDVIGEKLGMISGELMAIYVKQSYVLGVNNIISSLTCIIIIIVIVCLIKYLFNKKSKGELKDDDGDYGALYFFISVLIIIAGICFVIMIGEAKQAAGHLMNPEYYAVQDILNQLKK